MDIDSFVGTRSPGIVGSFSYDVLEDRWEWSDDLYRLHGYSPGEIPATTSALMHHKHADDRERAAAVFEAVVDEGGTYRCYHRIVDRSRRVLSVVSVGRSLRDAEGRTTVIDGYYIDLTSARRDETEADVQAALAGKAQSASVIEQAKGMIMLTERCTEDEAFTLLRTTSQLANRKLADIARELVSSATEGGAAAVRSGLGRGGRVDAL